MTPPDQRIALAVIDDYVQPFTEHEQWFEDGDSDGWEKVLRDDKGRRVPDYLNGLNAIHQIEVRLSTSKKHEVELSTRERFELILARITDSSLPISASAPQRCEAFLKATNLWKD